MCVRRHPIAAHPAPPRLSVLESQADFVFVGGGIDVEPRTRVSMGDEPPAVDAAVLVTVGAACPDPATTLQSHEDCHVTFAEGRVAVDRDGVVRRPVDVLGEGAPLRLDDARDRIAPLEPRLVIDVPDSVRCPHGEEAVEVTLIGTVAVLRGELANRELTLDTIQATFQLVHTPTVS